MYTYVNGGAAYTCLNSLVKQTTSPSAVVANSLGVVVNSNGTVVFTPVGSPTPGALNANTTGTGCTSCGCMTTTSDGGQNLTVQKCSDGTYTIRSPAGNYLTTSTATLQGTPAFTQSTPIAGQSYWKLVSVS